jgi:hypothetical protein
MSYVGNVKNTSNNCSLVHAIESTFSPVGCREVAGPRGRPAHEPRLAVGTYKIRLYTSGDERN